MVAVAAPAREGQSPAAPERRRRERLLPHFLRRSGAASRKRIIRKQKLFLTKNNMQAMMGRVDGATPSSLSRLSKRSLSSLLPLKEEGRVTWRPSSRFGLAASPPGIAGKAPRDPALSPARGAALLRKRTRPHPRAASSAGGWGRRAVAWRTVARLRGLTRPGPAACAEAAGPGGGSGRGRSAEGVARVPRRQPLRGARDARPAARARRRPGSRAGPRPPRAWDGRRRGTP